MTNKEQREWRKTITKQYKTTHKLIKVRPDDPRKQQWKEDDPRHNPEHIKQMKLLDEIIAKQKPVVNDPAPIEPKQLSAIDKPYQAFINKLGLKFIEVDIDEKELSRLLNAEGFTPESRRIRRERWDRGEYYNLNDYLISESPADRLARFKKGIMTPEEYDDCQMFNANDRNMAF
jgi:hypothetical protein